MKNDMISLHRIILVFHVSARTTAEYIYIHKKRGKVMRTRMRNRMGLLALALSATLLSGCGTDNLQKADSKVEIEAADSLLAPACINGKYGYIDANGDITIQFKYEDAQVFS